MGRRRKFTVKKKPFKKPQQKNHRGTKERKLHMGRLDSFEYRLKKMLEDVEAGGTIFGNIYSKAMNLGIADARTYVETMEKEGNLEKDKSEEIIDLLNRFSKYR